MQDFIKSLFIRIFLGLMPVTAYADQKCYGDIIVFQKFDDQMNILILYILLERKIRRMTHQIRQS